jgi:6-phosphogluconolactonase
MTPVIINRANQISFLAAGRKKAPALTRVLTGAYQPDTYPAQVIKPIRGTIRWFVDTEITQDLRR